MKINGLFTPPFANFALDINTCLLQYMNFLSENQYVLDSFCTVIDCHLWLNSCSAINLMFLLQEDRTRLTERIQNAGTEVVEAKAGAVSTANHHFHALVHESLARISSCSWMFFYSRKESYVLYESIYNIIGIWLCKTLFFGWNLQNPLELWHPICLN